MITFEDMTPGRVFELGEVAADREEMLEFARRYDPQPYHVDDAAAERSMFGRLAASGWYTAGLWMRRYVDVVLSDSTAMGSPGGTELAWPAPVHAGDVLRCRLDVLSARRSASRPRTGIVELRALAHRDDVCVFRSTMTGFFGTRET